MPAALVLETPEKTYLIQPGVSAHLGRHPSADIFLDDPTVSRLHAWLRWNREEDFPIVSDYQSMAGLEIDGQIAKQKHLFGEHTILLGQLELTARLYPTLADVPSYADLVELPTTEKVVTTKIKKISYYASSDTFKDPPLKTVRFKKPQLNLTPCSKPPVRGCLSTSEELQGLLVKLEQYNATGTLSLCCEYQGSITFTNGKVVGAECGRIHGQAALQQILSFANVSYKFITIVDNNAVEKELEITPSEFIKRIKRHSTDRVKRLSQRFRKVNR